MTIIDIYVNFTCYKRSPKSPFVRVPALGTLSHDRKTGGVSRGTAFAAKACFDPKDGAMLVLSRKQGERVCIGPDIEVTVLEIQGNRIKLGVSGPASVPVYRQELLEVTRAREAVGHGAGHADY